METPLPLTLRRLPVAELKDTDRTFAVSPEWLLPESLLESVRAVGVVTPLRVLPHQGGFRVVSGFRRLAAARAANLEAVPCMVLDAAGRGELELFIEALHENVGSRGLSELEQAVALDKLHRRFGVEEEELVRRHLPMLGMRPDRRHLLLALKIAGLPEDLQRCLPDLILEAALKLSTWQPAERLLFVDLRRRYRLGRNRQRELLELLDELRASERRADPAADARTAWEKSGAAAEDSPEDPTPARLERILDALRQSRYPVLSECERRARQLQSALRLPPEIQFNLPRHFEGDRIIVQFAARDPEQFRRLAERLLESSRRPELEELFALL